MNDHISYEGNSETRGTAPVQFFEAGGSAPPAGTKATPRPADRPRELPPGGPSSAAFQLFESEGPASAEGATARPQPGDREEGDA